MKKLFLIIRHSYILVFLGCYIPCFSQTQPLQPTEKEALVNFKITDHNSVPEEGAVVKLEDVKDKKVLSDTADIDGFAPMLLSKGKSYKLWIEKFGAKFDFGMLDISSQGGKITQDELLQIKVVTKYNRIYELKIHFASGKADLYPAAKEELDKLYADMIKNPTMKIEVAGHTDNVGADDVNRRVSQNRANSIKAYLLEKGISEKRVIAKGYGETAPVASNDTEEGRNKNRRIEIRML